MTSTSDLRQIPQQPNHLISQSGEIYWKKPNGELMLKPGKRRLKEGYCCVRFSYMGRGSKKRTIEYRLHVLILSAWVGPCPDGCEGMHKDDDHTNNHLSNLEWGTRSQNMQTRADRGAGKRGPNRPWSEKLRIAAKHPGKSYRTIGLEEGMHIGTVWHIVDDVKRSLVA